MVYINKHSKPEQIDINLVTEYIIFYKYSSLKFKQRVKDVTASLIISFFNCLQIMVGWRC